MVDPFFLLFYNNKNNNNGELKKKMLDNFGKIWEALNRLYEAEYKNLNSKSHMGKHEDELAMVFDHPLSEEEYKEISKIVSELSVFPIGIGDISIPHGYINQKGNILKFVRVRNDLCFQVVFSKEGSDGIIITSYFKRYDEIIRSANPFRKTTSNNANYRYKSDVDGGYKGLEYFQNINLSKDEVTRIKNDILRGKKLK